MDGFFTNAGIWAMGYYTEDELPLYCSLFDEFTLCENFFCSVLGPTWPNRFYLAAGTSGGITTNGVWGYGIFDYPIILDLLDAAGVRTLGSKGTYRMTSARVGSRSCRSSSRASPVAGTSIRPPTCRSGWASRRSSSRRCASRPCGTRARIS
jgi:hypothetical protein